MGLALVAMLASAGIYFSEHDALVTHQHTPSAQADDGHDHDKDNVPMPGKSDQSHLLALMEKLKANPNDVGIMMMISEHFLSSGDFPMAEMFSGRVLKVEAHNADALYIRGIARHRLDRHAEAAADFELAKDIHDGFAVRYNLGMLYLYFLKDKEKARENLAKAITFPNVSADMLDAVKKELDALK